MTRTVAPRLVDQLKALGDPTRLKVVRTLAAGPLPVTAIAAAVGVTFNNLSHHIKQLTQAGIIAGRKAGREVHYGFADGVYEPPAGGRHLGTLHLAAGKMILGPADGRLTTPPAAPSPSARSSREPH